MNKAPKRLFLHVFKMKNGQVRMASTEKGLAILLLPHEPEARMNEVIEAHFADYEIEPGGETNRKAEKELKEYFAGKRKTFTIPLDIQASGFYAKVLRQVARIPYGTTMSYSEVARAVGNPRAMRAVGTANAGNHISILVPSHRVVRKDGLGGYGSCGTGMKRELLAREGIILQ